MRKDVKATKKYWFVSGEELNNPSDFDAFLFNDPAHLALQPSKNRHSYYLIKKHDEVIYARCTFFIEEGIAYSPYKSSFGSIEFSDKVFFELLEEFWDLVEEDLKAKGTKEIMIKNYPVCYHPAHSQLLSYLFSTKGFSVKTQELNFHIDVDERGFEERVHENEKRKLKLAQKKGLVVKVEKEINVEEFYSFFEKSRKARGIPITMAKEELEKLLQKFPKEHLLFECFENNILIALCLTIQINKKILYTFYLADDCNRKEMSPLVYIYEEIYKYSQLNKHKIIDLGIGSDKGISNFGLIRFKEKIGGDYSHKVLFYKSLSF